jgi:hypothetical protein
MMETTTKSKRAARVRLTVQCGDDLRFFEIPLRTARAAGAEGFQRAISLAALSFSQTFDAELKTQTPLGKSTSSMKIIDAFKV